MPFYLRCSFFLIYRRANYSLLQICYGPDLWAFHLVCDECHRPAAVQLPAPAFLMWGVRPWSGYPGGGIGLPFAERPGFFFPGEEGAVGGFHGLVSATTGEKGVYLIRQTKRNMELFLLLFVPCADRRMVIGLRS